MKQVRFKSIVSLAVVLLMCSNSKITFAAIQDIVDDSTQQITSEGGIVVDIQQFNLELENYLDQHMNLINNHLYVINRGVYKPTATWDFNTNKFYAYTVDTQGSTIYYNYKFINHGGTIAVKAKETIGQSALIKTYKIRLRNGNTDSVVATATVNRGEIVYVNFSNLNKSTPYYVEFSVSSATKIVDGLIFN